MPRRLRIASIPVSPGWPSPWLQRFEEHLDARDDVERIEVDFGPGMGDVAADIVHVHWPEALLGGRWRPAVHLARLQRLASRCHGSGGAVVWTIHNVLPHDRRGPWVPLAWRQLARLTDSLLSLSEHALDEMRQQWPSLADVPSAIVGHGEMRGVHGRVPGRSEARDELGLDRADRVIAFTGLLRAYKGVPELMDAFGRLDDDQARLVIAGRSKDATLEADVRRAAADDSRVILRLDGGDATMAAVLGAADLVTLPYRAITHSGAAITALSHDRPVLVPAVGAMPEWQSQLGRDWMLLHDTPIDAGALEAGLAAAADLRDQRWPVPKRQEWGTVMSEVMQLYEESLRERRRHRGHR